MSVALHPDAKDNFNNKAQKLISSITQIERDESHKRKKAESEFYASHTLTEEDLIGDITIELKDGFGNEHGKIFYYNNNEYGIVYENYKKLIKLSENIQRVNELKDIVSVDFVKEQLFIWLKKSFKKEIDKPFVLYLLEKVQEDVVEYEIWIPIPFTSIAKTFSLGEIVYKTITKSKIESWIKETQNGDLSDDKLNKVKEFKEKLKKNYQGYAAGVFNCKAESIRAHELAYSSLSDSLSILRLFTAANHSPELVCGVYEYGDKMMRTKKYFTVNKKTDGFSVNSSVIDQGLYVNLEDHIIDSMNKDELSFYNKLLQIKDRNKFQEKLLEAIMIYSKHTLSYKKYDKLLYILVGVETILLKNDSEPIQQNIGDRMAFLIGNNLEERREITKTLRKAYTMRSRFIHHGKFSNENMEIMQKFMNYVWLTFSTIVRNIYKFETKQEFIKSIEELKYS